MRLVLFTLIDDNTGYCTYRWIQQARYCSILRSPCSTTALISSTNARFCLRPISSSSSPTKRIRRALPSERKDGRFSTVSSGYTGQRSANDCNYLKLQAQRRRSANYPLGLHINDLCCLAQLLHVAKAANISLREAK